MLVISRKVGQSVFIGEDIVIQVCRISDGKVRIGIQAPPDVNIWRDDVKNKSPKPKTPKTGPGDGEATKP